MRFVRYQFGKDEPRFGWVYDNQVGPLEGTPFGDYRRLDADIPLGQVRLLAPVLPGKIIGVGRNYIDRTREQGVAIPEIPEIFFKPPSAVIGMGEAIMIPPQSQQVEHEAELAIIIAKSGRWISPEKVNEYIFGFTVGNDVTARDLERKDVHFARAKGFDTFCPLGPWIETEFDATDVLITCRISGELRQMASTREMIFNVAQLVVFISAVMTLQPGDVILTGTPAGVGPLKHGDQMETSIEGIGSLNNPVRISP